MARGWESKAIEAQQADADANRQPRGAPLTPEQQAFRRQIEGLELSKKNVLQQLQAATDPRRRQMLEHSLAELQQKIRALNGSS
jgi:hypothetical protein